MAAGSQLGPSQPAASFLHHHRRTNSVTAAHGHADSNCDPHADSNRHRYGDTYCHAHTVADPDAHSDTNGYPRRPGGQRTLERAQRPWS